MKRFHYGDIVLVDYPYTHLSDSKKRPGMVLRDTQDGDLVVAKITSKLKVTTFDTPLKKWKEAGLLYPSIVRIHKISTLNRNLIERSLGRVLEKDMKRIKQTFRRFWKPLF